MPIPTDRAVLLARERVERALRESEERLRVTLASIGDGVIVCDVKGQVTYLNPVAEALTGWTQVEAVGKSLDSVFKIVDEHTREVVDNPCMRVLREGASAGLANHTVLISRDGKERTIDDSAAPIRDADGNISGVVLIFRDVRERRSAELLLQLQKDTLELLVSGTPLPQVLEALAKAMQSQSKPRVLSAIHLLDETETRLGLVVAPSLPESYRKATEGMDINSKTGPCCLAVLTRETVIVADFESDPQWKAFAEIARPLGIRGGWSMPIISSRGKVVGTFANYYDQVRGPSEQDIAVIDVLTRTVALAIERAHAEETRSRLAAIVESSDDAIISKDLNGIITSWNRGAQRLFGYEASEAIGQPITILIPPDRLDEEPNILERIRSGDRIDHFETIRVRKDGTLLDVSLSVSPVNNVEGKIVGASKIARDITGRRRADDALRQSEERFRSLVSVITDVPWTVDPDGRFVVAQAAWEAYTGQSWEDHCDFGWLNVLHPEDRDRVKETWERARTSATLYESEARLWHAASQQWRHIVTRATPLLDASGRVREWVGSCKDVDERKRAETDRERLLESEQQARREADVANRMKDEFLATVSHELRTPLNAIMGWTHILSRGKLDDDTFARGLETIARNANAQNQLVADLLDVSRIISGRFRFESGVVDLIPVIEAAADTVRPAADAKGVELRLLLESKSGLMSGDSVRLQQIVWNLLSNAVKFTPKDGQVTVRLKRDDSNVIIIISDTGEGISAEFLPYIFDRFRQAESTTRRHHGGLGLGLAIVRHLVEAHGGTIHAFSEGLQKGATFEVAFPLIAVTRARDYVRRAYDEEEDESSAVLKGLRVLVIDDEPDARELLTLTLSHRGAEVRAADSVAAALHILGQWKPDVLVSDIGMPGEDGYDLIRTVRALESKTGGNIPALALTGFASSEDAERAHLAGYQAHMTKPVSPGDLIETVANLAATARSK